MRTGRRWTLHQPGVDAREPDRRHLGPAKGRQQIGIDRAGEGHLDHFQRVAVGDRPPGNDFRRNAQPAAEGRGLCAAAVDQHDSDAELVQHRDLVGQIRQRRAPVGKDRRRA